MALNPGDQFDRYIIGAMLGKGGMGEVYRATDTRLQRTVALKILRGDPEVMGTDGRLSTEGAARMLREARAAAAMDHPNAVAIFDVGDHDGQPYLAMEFIAGRTLRAFVGADVPIDRRVRWLVDMARALGAAHKRGLVHRDVKPENVMVRDDGVVKVLDFGIARRTHAPVNPTGATEQVALETLTAKGIVVGTPVYMSPEQMRGERLDGRADQFSWGVVAYELLAGSIPWTATGGQALQLVSQILSMPAEPPTTRNPAIPAEVEAVIMAALSKSASDRFESMDHLVQALEPWAAASISLGAPLASQRPGSAKSAFPSGKTTPTGAGKAYSSRTQLAAAGTPRSLPAAAARGSKRTKLVAIAGGVVALAGVAAIAVGMKTGAPKPTVALADASRASLAWVDTGSQPSANGDATAAYRAGMQGVRDASMERARVDLERATSTDPTFAAAHLRAALAAEHFDTPARAHIQRAIQLRQSLSAHDRALLDAIEPWTHVPPDLRESESRLVAAVAKEPENADALYLLGATRLAMRESKHALDALAAALTVDPGIASAYRLEGRAELALGETAAASKAYDECLRVSPAATWCIRDLAELDSNEGKCDEVEKLARRLIALDPQSRAGYASLAVAVYGRGQPIESARVALEQAWQRETGDARAAHELAWGEKLAAIAGDFVTADARLADWDAKVASSPDEWDHVAPFRERVLVAIETGRMNDAVKIADDYMKRRAAWTPDDFREEPTIYGLIARYRAGAITRDAMNSERVAWLHRDDERRGRIGRGPGDSRGDAWALAYAAMATTEADAREALGALGSAKALPDPIERTPPIDAAVGDTYRLAGNVDESLPFLGRASHACSALEHPIEQTRAALSLGLAEEAKGDKAAACAAYGVVLSRWGTAKPRSSSADTAKAHSKALGCGG